MRFAKFVLTNISGMVLETTVLLALSSVLTSKVALFAIAPMIAFEVATLSNFTIGYNWTWRERVEPSWEDFWARFLKFNLSVLGVFAARLGLIALLGFSFGLSVVVCNLIVLTFSGLANFGAQDRLVFGSKEPVGATRVPVQVVPW